MTEESQEGLHPLVKEVLMEMYRGEGRMAWSSDIGERLKDKIAKMLFSDDLRWAIESILDVGKRFSDLGHAKIAQEMVATTVSAVEVLERADRQNVGGELKSRVESEFARFSDNAKRLNVGKDEEDKPEGSVQLGNMNFNRRI